jgi:large subunit ribosomal protein L24e
MVQCIFCGHEEHAFKGVHLIRNDGSIAYFCSSTCRKNMLKLGRDKRTLKWTVAYVESRDKAKAKAAALAAKK